MSPAKTRQKEDEASQIERVDHDKTIDSVNAISSVIEKDESNGACAEPIDSKEASFIDQEHGGKLSKTAVLDFSGCKGAYLLPYEFRAKEIDEHHVQEIIAERSSVDIKHKSNGA